MKQFKKFAIPYFVWLIILVVVPILVMTILTFMNSNGTDFADATVSIESYKRLADVSLYKALWNSLKVALFTVIICVLLGYPCAYFLSFSNIKNKMLVLLMLILPMWCNSMLRIISWYKLFQADGFAALKLAGSEGAVVFVTVTTYLPFMIFPIFSVLEKMDRSLIEASKDLGISAPKTFLKVTLPLSLTGVSSGVIMVFLPAATGFAISQTIGQGKVQLIGNVIQSVFEKNNYNLGSLLSLIVSIVIIICIVLFQKLQGKRGEN
jgi:spermidine/putrescine transport system permease protein